MKPAWSDNMRLAIGIVMTVALAVPAALAQSVAFSRTAPSHTQDSVDTALNEAQARTWGLRPDDWTRYQQLMRGPLGVYSPGLDPLTALGIEARGDAERAHFAELQAKAEAQRTQKELAYQRAYDAAWQRLFAGERRVNLPGALGPAADNQGSGRLAVFVKAGCTPCDQRVRQLQAAGTAFDLYVVGSRQDDARIREWAVGAGIDPARVRAHTITLNHDGGRWLSLGLSGDLPAVVREVNGHWVRQ